MRSSMASKIPVIDIFRHPTSLSVPDCPFWHVFVKNFPTSPQTVRKLHFRAPNQPLFLCIIKTQIKHISIKRKGVYTPTINSIILSNPRRFLALSIYIQDKRAQIHLPPFVILLTGSRWLPSLFLLFRMDVLTGTSVEIFFQNLVERKT